MNILTQPAKAGMADPELDQLWLDRDPGALAELHRRYRTRLEAVAFRILGNQADAEDVVQKVFLALPRAAYRGSASLWSYLYRAASNGSVNVLRSKRRHERAQQELIHQAALREPSSSSDPEAQVLEGEILAQVARALSRVKVRYRRVLVLRIVHNFTNTEIASREGVPLATVGTWLRRGREELRRELGPLVQDFGRTRE